MQRLRTVCAAPELVPILQELAAGLAGDDRSVKIKSLGAAKTMKIKRLVLGCIEVHFSAPQQAKTRAPRRKGRLRRSKKGSQQPGTAMPSRAAGACATGRPGTLRARVSQQQPVEA